MTAFKFGQKRKKVDDLQSEKAENGSDLQSEKAENASDFQTEKAGNGSELQASIVAENECSKSCVCAKNLTVKYGEKVIFENLNIEFAKDKINVILGSSGVGKTTLLNVLAGLKEFDGTLEGADGNVSYIFQKDRLIPTISVYKNLDLVLKAKIADRHERKKRIIDMLEMLEISDLIDILPTKISGGQAQRVALARAFLFPSKILLMDEPFRALDTALKSRL
ncbi:MAG: ATP-binding cassette domain-containing protein [Clostridia bacterium]